MLLQDRQQLQACICKYLKALEAHVSLLVQAMAAEEAAQKRVVQERAIKDIIESLITFIACGIAWVLYFMQAAGST